VVRTPGSPGALAIETVPDPVPGEGQVVIAVEACGVCFHDVVTRNGTLKSGIRLPFIPGHEVAGTVAALGTGMRGLKVGDRVATTQRVHVCGACRYCRSAREPLCAEAVFMGDAGLNGGYAEYVATDAATIARIPDGVGFDEAAIAACAIGTMLHAVRTVGRVRLGETVLVTGAGGGLGIHGIQLAKAAGARVVGQTSSPAKEAMIRAAGADAVVIATRGADFSAAVRDATGGEGADVVLDTVGTPLFAPTRKSLARGGRWVLIGQLTGDFVPFNPAQLFLRSVSLLSATSTTRDELADVLGLIARGTVRPAIDRTMPLAEAAAAHAALESGRVAGRIVLRPGA
jgi:acryloyl-coenzyme A reductase